MRREQLTEVLAGFEAKEPVADWRFRGWRAWPALRMRLALALHVDSGPPVVPSRVHALAAGLGRRRQRLERWLVARRERSQPAAPVDAIFLSRSDRAQWVGAAFVNTVVDPWVEEAARAGARARVWELGDAKRPCDPRHVAIQHALDRAGRTLREPGPPPEWFAVLASFARRELACELAWADLGRELAALDAQAALFEGWLRAAAPRALLLDCWYQREGMAAALAAHRVGVPVIDLQHGIQGRAHPAYSGWSLPPPGGYELFPRAFWVWGRWDAESLLAHNPAIQPDAVRIVGNRWLAEWTEPSAPDHVAEVAAAGRGLEGRRALLVSLQKGVPFRDELPPLLRVAPPEMPIWLRLHRGMDEDPRRLAQELARSVGRPVEAVEATRRPLYALLPHCAWHVTAFSTVALEALAFGVPSLLTHPSGGHAFADFVACGAMAAPASPDEAARLLSAPPGERSEICRRAARRVFAAPTSWRIQCTSS